MSDIEEIRQLTARLDAFIRFVFFVFDASANSDETITVAEKKELREAIITAKDLSLRMGKLEHVFTWMENQEQQSKDALKTRSELWRSLVAGVVVALITFLLTKVSSKWPF